MEYAYEKASYECKGENINTWFNMQRTNVNDF
jgi:hypothetical protein